MVENNSFEIFQYPVSGTARVFIDLSDFYTWYISFDAGQTAVSIYNQELGGQQFGIFGEAGKLGILQSNGSSLPSGVAQLWIHPTQAGFVFVMGTRRS